MDYCELHLHTSFSLLDGASAPEDLIARAREIGLPALAITDHDNLYAASAFWREARSAGIKPIVGAEVTVTEGERRQGERKEGGHGEGHHLTLLARDHIGYANLCRLLTCAHLAGTKGKPKLELSQLSQFSPGLWCLSGCKRGRLSSLLLAGWEEEARHWARKLLDIFAANFWIELQNHLCPEDRFLNRQLIRLARQLDIGYLATNNVHYAYRSGHRLQDILVCIRHRTTLEGSVGLRRPNSELFLKSGQEMAALFPEHPEAIRHTLYVAEQCHLDLDFTPYRFPRYP
ncbi:MAG TPA: PHP domain-containing protein, partial [Firmicutes bacterium]|nr:PHP domain-containing protein [Bacillota bacterium]